MLEEKEKMPASETCDTPMFNVKAGAGNKADMSAVDTLTSSTQTYSIKDFWKMIVVLIPFLSGKKGLIFKDFGDGTKAVYFEEKEKMIASQSSSITGKKNKSWKDHPNEEVLKAMLDDGLLEPFNTADVKGLKLTKNFSKSRFMKYETAFGSMKAFGLLGEEQGILFTVSGRTLNPGNLREYLDYHIPTT